jgi:hypothetical protein
MFHGLWIIPVILVAARHFRLTGLCYISLGGTPLFRVETIKERAVFLISILKIAIKEYIFNTI